MGPRAAIALAALSSLLLIGCDSLYGNGMPSTDLGVAVDLSRLCSATIEITASPAPTGPAILAPADLIAHVTNASSALEKPDWTGIGPDGQPFSPEVTDGASGLTVKYHADRSGSYTFIVDYPLSGCRGDKSVVLMDPDASSQDYRFRVSPPTALGIPQQDLKISVHGHTPNSAQDLSLMAGDVFTGTLRGPGGTGLAGEVRLHADNAPDALALTNAGGQFSMAISNFLDYTVILIPKDPSLAPASPGHGTGTSALGALAFGLDAGQAVSGTVRDAADAPIAGVKVVLRSGQLPSSVGISANDGSYSLRAQAGTYIASIGADGWPELAVPGMAAPSTLDVKYLVTRTAKSASVVDSSGKPIAGARVTLRSPILSGAATVNSQSVSGRHKQVLISGSDGSLTGLQLVSGVYDILVEPPAGASDGVTHMVLADSAGWTLQTTPKITLSGRVTDLSGTAVAGVKITAFETAGLGAAPTTTSSSGGTFSIVVDAGSPLEVLYEPPATTNLSSLRQVVAAGSTTTAAALGPGLRIGGSVLQGTSRLGSVLIEALCGSCGSDVPIASTISDPHGSYALYLPDPGTRLGDGGVNDASP